tara:strand:- start:218 stop:598 length:381 start_codon:yes stop_codon:yes gene_type:complete
MLTGFSTLLIAVPATPFLITFEQPDGSRFQAYLRGDEYFSWIETENKLIIVKNEASGFFEFAVVKRDAENRYKLVPSGTSVIQSAQSVLKAPGNLPKISRDQLGAIWKSKIAERRNLKIMPAKKSP